MPELGPLKIVVPLVWDPVTISHRLYSICTTILPAGLNWPGSETDNSASCVEVTHEWSYTSTTCMCLHSVQRDNFVISVELGSFALRRYLFIGNCCVVAGY
jgi:hypothetical protein